MNPVTSATRIPLIANGTIDLECGSTTNNLDREKQVAFTNTYFVTANRYVAKKSSNIKTLADLKGKTVVSTSGTTNIKWLTEENGKQNLGMNIIPAKDHAEAFLMVETDRAVAFFMDDILLYSLVASSKTPGDYVIGSEAYSVEPYGTMMPKDDPEFTKVVNTATANLYKSGADQRDLRQMVPEADSAEGHQPQRADEPAAEGGVCQSDRTAAIRPPTSKAH